jgi:flagellar biosynthetic protein FliR
LLNTLLVNHFLTFTLVLSRVSGLVMTAPIFGSQSAPMQIRGLLAAAIALLVAPSCLGMAIEHPTTLVDYIVYIASELLIGMALGLGIQILLGGIQVAGQIISQLSGMSLADVFNPTLETETPVVAQVLSHVTLAVFILIDGHRMVMKALLDTFEAIPPAGGLIGDSVVASLVAIVTQSFHVGIRAAAPAMAALLLSTLVLAIVSRTLPQLNVLLVGFNLNSLLTFGVLLVSLGGVAWAFQDQVAQSLDHVHDALREDAGVRSAAEQ